jgi:hypothetical protein
MRSVLGQFGAKARARVGKRDIRIVAVRVVCVLAGLELAYVLGANALLRSDGVVALVEAADGVKLDYASAYSVVPGHVHVKRLRLRFEDYNVQFQVFVEKGTLDIGLSELVARKFHVYSLLADGVSFRMRHKSHGVGNNAERFAAYPKIEGFADPPLYHGVKSPSTPDDQYDLWQVRIDDVVAHANELWVLEYRYTGDAEARGSFLVQPERLVRVEPAALRIRRGTLRVGATPVARQLNGTIECSVPHLDVKNTVGVEVFHSISTKLDLNLADGDARFLNVYGAPKHEPKVSGPLSMSIRARITRGVVEPGTQLLAATPALELAWPNVTSARTRAQPERDAAGRSRRRSTRHIVHRRASDAPSERDAGARRGRPRQTARSDRRRGGARSTPRQSGLVRRLFRRQAATARQRQRRRCPQVDAKGGRPWRGGARAQRARRPGPRPDFRYPERC